MGLGVGGLSASCELEIIATLKLGIGAGRGSLHRLVRPWPPALCCQFQSPERQERQDSADKDLRHMYPEPSVSSTVANKRSGSVIRPDQCEKDQQAGGVHGDSGYDRFGQIGDCAQHRVDKKIEEHNRPQKSLS